MRYSATKITSIVFCAAQRAKIPSDFLSKATEFCKSMGCSSVIYDIYDPQDSEHSKLRVLDCGYAE